MATIYLDGRAPEKLNPKDFIPKLPTQPILLKTTPPSTAIDAYTKKLQNQAPTPYLQQQTFGIPQPSIPRTSYLQQQTLNTAPNVPLAQTITSNSFGGYTGNQVLQSVKDVGRSFANAVKGEVASNLDTSENNPAIRARNFLESIGTKPIKQYVPISPNKITALQMQMPKMSIMPINKQEPVLRDPARLAMLEQQKNKLQQSIVNTSMKSAQERQQIEQKYAGVSLGLKTAGQLIGGVGQVLPIMALSAVSPLTGMQLLYGQAAGGEISEALAADADIQAAKKAGISSGLTEITIEKLFGGIPFMGKGIANNILNADELVKKYIKSPAGQAIVKTAYGALGEGTEEVISEIISPFIKRAYYDKNAPLPTFEELAMAFGSGAVASAILGGASNTIEQISNRPQKQIQPLAKQQELTQEVPPIEPIQPTNVAEPTAPKSQLALPQPKMYVDPQGNIEFQMRPIGIDTIEAAKQKLSVAEDAVLKIMLSSKYENSNISDDQKWKNAQHEAGVNFAQLEENIETAHWYENLSQSDKAILLEDYKTQQPQEVVYSPVNAKQTLQQLPPIQPIKPVQPPQRTPQGKAFLPPTIKNQRIMAQNFPNSAETISSGIKHNASEADINRISELSERMGVKIVFENNKTGNGRYQNDTIYINKNSQTPIKDTFIHELTHYIEKSGKYNDFANAVMDSDVFLREIHDSGLTVAEYKQRIKDDYLQNGVVLGDDGVNHEIVAKFAESYLSDEQTINRLAKTNATVFEKIKQWVDDMLQRFRGTNEERSLLKMRRLYDKALKSVGEAKGAGAEFSVVTKPDGEYRVVVDRNIFKGKTVAERPATLKKYIMENIRGKEFKSLVDGETIKTPQSNNDIGKLSRPGLKMADEKYAARLNTAAHLDEVIQVSSLANSVADEGGKHKEKAAEGIDYRTFEIEIPQLDESDNIVDASVWRGQLTVLKSENGELAYDISRLKDISKDTYSVLYRLKKSEAEIDKVSYNKIISNISKKVNSQYSVEKGTVQQATERAEQPTPINKKPMQEKPEDVEEVVRVLIKTPREALPKTERLKEINNLIKRKLVDSGEAIGRISRIAKDPTLYYAYNNAKQAKQMAESMLMEQQSDIHGNKIGKSLIEIFEPIQKQGDKVYQDFSEYMLHLHNVDRMEHGKPIFGDNETKYTSRQKAEALLAANPEFAITANDVYIYNRNLMQYRVDSGLVSREQADLMNIMYPHYVPTFRDVTRSGRSKAQRTKVKINQSVSTATGGESDILPLHANMARQTMQTIKMAKANVLGLRLYNNALNLRGVLGEYVGEITPQGETFDIDKGEGNVFKMRNEFVVYDNGEPVVMKVNSDVFEGLEAIAGASGQENNITQAARKANNAFKELVTGKNPVFMLKNGPRDIQEAGLYTENLADFIKTYPKAFAEITSNSSLFRKYKALGGFGSSVFDYDQGYDPSKIYNKNGVAKAFDKIEEGNFLVEQLPRFTEFMAQIKRGGEGYDNLMRAMYMAADVTVNFGRSGTWGKTLNSTFVPFFNPAMQGFDKLIRTYTQAKGAKEWTTLVLRTVSLAIAPALLNEFVNGDDEEYELISDREKDLNYLFKIKDGLWAKIPKGRVVSVFGGAAQRTLRQTRGEENAWAGFISTAVSQVAPTNPFTNHILMQAINTDLFNADSPGKTWYGTDIEPQRLRGFRPGLRFDEKTDYFSKWVGNVLNVSPKKINYLLDSYTGVIGDFALPLLTPQAERDPFSKAFTIDPVMQNKLSQQFYEKLTQLEQAKNDINEPDKYNLMYRYMNKQAQALTEFNKEIRKIEMSNISNADKKQEVREIKVVINGIQQNALMGLKEYNKAVVITGDAEKDYINANRKAFGAEYALETYDKKVYEKAVKTGVSYDAFLDAYFAQKDVKGNGEPLVASKNKMAAIDAATPHISKEERKKLYKAFDVSEKVWEETLSAPAEKVSSISTGKYEEYNKEIAKFKAEYYPNSKNEITASRKQKVYDYIKTLPLTKEQKEELYLSYYKDYGRLVVDGVKLPNGYKPLKK